MPGGDRTGPLGMGPMTGRAAGYCAGYNVPGYANPAPGRGYWGTGRGFGGGRGRGHRHMFYATGLPAWARSVGVPYAMAPYGAQPYIPQSNPEQELGFLKDQAEYFQNALEDINKRITELEKDVKSK